MKPTKKIKLLVSVVIVMLIAIGVSAKIYFNKIDEEKRIIEAQKYENQELFLPEFKKMKENRKVGNNSADKTLYIACSFLSSHCADFYKNVFPILESEYIDVGELNVVFYDIITDNKDMLASMVSRCVEDDKKYVQLLQTLYNNQRHWFNASNPTDALIGYGRISGLNYASSKACLENEALLKELGKQSADIQDEYNINATPFFVLKKGKREKIVKNYNELFNAIKKF